MQTASLVTAISLTSTHVDDRAVTTLVLVPGSLCTAELFTTVLPIAGVNTIVTDTPEADSINEMAAAVTRLVASIDGPVVVGGLSLGGIVAAAAAVQDPQRFAGVVVIDANLAAADDAQVATRARWAEAVRGGRLLVVAEELLPQATVNPVANRDIVLRMASETGSVRFLAQNKALATRHDLTDALAATGLPVLLVCGADDAVSPVERHRVMLERIAGASLVVVPAAGHLLSLDRPLALRAAIEEWCAGPREGRTGGTFA